MSAADSFWLKVGRGEPAECWLWLAATNEKGYGVVSLNGRIQRAHRVAWELTNGPIPAGLSVLHRCDVPGCCNPEHLFLGTHRDNVEDCRSKDRYPRGERSYQAKLTAEQIAELRQVAPERGALSAFARKHGVSPSTAWDIARGRTWKTERD